MNEYHVDRRRALHRVAIVGDGGRMASPGPRAEPGLQARQAADASSAMDGSRP